MIWLKKLSNLTEVNAFLIGFYLIGKKQYFPTNTHSFSTVLNPFVWEKFVLDIEISDSFSRY